MHWNVRAVVRRRRRAFAECGLKFGRRDRQCGTHAMQPHEPAMRLIDQLAQARTAYEVIGAEGVLGVPGAADRRDVGEVPLRYILQPSIAALCRALLSTDRGMLATDNMLLRAPAPRLWVEWEEELKVGLLVEADESGRRGRVELFWEQAGSDPALAQAMLTFDLDRALPAPRAGSATFRVRGDEHPLADHLRFHLAPAWMRHLFADGAAAGREAVALICASVLRDVEMLFAFAPLLLHRHEIALVPRSLDRLNQQRLARRKAALLDHIEVALKIGGAPMHSAVPGGSGRASRLHLVRGHMVHRRDQIYWRRSHLRGHPLHALASRTVQLR